MFRTKSRGHFLVLWIIGMAVLFFGCVFGDENMETLLIKPVPSLSSGEPVLFSDPT